MRISSLLTTVKQIWQSIPLLIILLASSYIGQISQWPSQFFFLTISLLQFIPKLRRIPEHSTLSTQIGATKDHTASQIFSDHIIPTLYNTAAILPTLPAIFSAGTPFLMAFITINAAVFLMRWKSNNDTISITLTTLCALISRSLSTNPLAYTELGLMLFFVRHNLSTMIFKVYYPATMLIPTHCESVPKLIAAANALQEEITKNDSELEELKNAINPTKCNYDSSKIQSDIKTIDKLVREAHQSITNLNEEDTTRTRNRIILDLIDTVKSIKKFIEKNRQHRDDEIFTNFKKELLPLLTKLSASLDFSKITTALKDILGQPNPLFSWLPSRVVSCAYLSILLGVNDFPLSLLMAIFGPYDSPLPLLSFLAENMERILTGMPILLSLFECKSTVLLTLHSAMSLIIPWYKANAPMEESAKPAMTCSQLRATLCELASASPNAESRCLTEKNAFLLAAHSDKQQYPPANNSPAIDELFKVFTGQECIMTLKKF